MESCEWEVDRNEEFSIWNTACGNTFQFETGGPIENGFAYCPYCGCALTQRAADASPAGFEDEEFDALLDSDIDGK